MFGAMVDVVGNAAMVFCCAVVFDGIAAHANNRHIADDVSIARDSTVNRWSTLALTNPISIFKLDTTARTIRRRTKGHLEKFIVEAYAALRRPTSQEVPV